MENIEISIIIPIYNSEKYLRECLDSALNQSVEVPFEVIAVLNPSTDNSENILIEYSKKYQNLITLKLDQLNGPAPTRFAGIKKARGKYLCFLDSDDYYHQDFVKTMYSEIIKGYDVINCNFFSYANSKAKASLFKSNKKMDSVQSIKHLLLDAAVRSFTVTKMYKKELFSGKIYYPKRKGVLFEDTIILFSVLLQAKSMKSIKTSLYYYRVNPNSLTQVVNKERFNYHLYTFAFIKHICDTLGDEYVKIFKQTYLRSYWSLWFDANLLKKEFNHGAFKHLRLYKKQLKYLKSKKPLPVEGEVWESYIKDCL